MGSRAPFTDGDPSSPSLSRSLAASVNPGASVDCHEKECSRWLPSKQSLFQSMMDRSLLKPPRQIMAFPFIIQLGGSSLHKAGWEGKVGSLRGPWRGPVCPAESKRLWFVLFLAGFLRFSRWCSLPQFKGEENAQNGIETRQMDLVE